MRIKDLVRQLIIPAWLMWGFFSLTTFVSHFTGTQASSLLSQFDLRLEANLAAWYASGALLLACLSCLTLAHPPFAPGLNRLDVWFFKAGAFGLLILSVLEISQFHNVLASLVQNAWTGSKTPGYVIVGIAAFPFVALGWIYYLRFSLRQLPLPGHTRLALLLLVIIALAPPVWGYLTVIEKITWSKQGAITLFSCLEESLETALALAIATLNAVIAQGVKS